MGWISVLAILVAATVNVRVATLDGDSIIGDMVELGPDGVRFADDDGGRLVPLAEILSIERVDAVASMPAAGRVELAGGSRLAFESITADDSSARLKLAGRMELSVPLKRLSWVRFRPASPAVDPQWIGLIERARVADSLVVRRSGDSIDEVSGVVLAIGPETVSFSLDGDAMRAPVTRLEGLLFAAPGGDETGAASADGSGITIDDIHGSRWQAVSLSVGSDSDGDQPIVGLELAGDIRHELPLSQILKVELSGSVEFLAGQTPAEMAYQPLLPLGLSDNLLTTWLGPEVISGRDLVMRSTSHIEYRVSEGFQRLNGGVELAPEVASGGTCVVRVVLDGKNSWEETLDVVAPKPRGFDLPIDGVRRIRFEVDAATVGDVGDTIVIRQPRMTK